MPDNLLEGQVAVPTEIQQKSAVGMTGGAQLPDSGWSSAFDAAAAEMKGLSKSIGAWADHAAAKEGAQAGELAGLDPEFRPSRELTIRGEAFDKAGLQIMQARLKQGITEDFLNIADKAGADPVKVGKLIDEKANGWLKNAPTELQAELNIFIEGKRLDAVRSAKAIQRENFIQEQRAAQHDEFTIELKSAQQQAFKLGLDGQADGVLADRLTSIEGMLKRKGLDGRPLFSPMERTKVMEGLKQEIAEARIVGTFSRLPDLEAKRKAIDKLSEDFGNSSGLAANFTRDQFHRVQNELEREYTRARTQAHADFGAVKHAVDGAIKLAESGMAIKPEALSQLQTRVAATKDPELMNSFADMQSIFSTMSWAATQTPEVIDGKIRELRGQIREDGTTTREKRLLDHLETLKSNMVGGLAKDPNGWADKTGLVKMTPVDASSVDKLIPSLAARVPQAEAIAAHYGRKVDYLTPEEQQQLGARIAKGGPDALAVFGAVATAAPQRREAIMAELGKHGPAVAALGQLYFDQGATPAVKSAAAGLALMREPDHQAVTAKLAPSQTLGEIDGATDGALARDPRSMAAITTLANAMYEQEALLKRKTMFDPGTYREMVRKAVGESEIGGHTYGGIVRQGWWNHQSVVIPPFVRADKWSDAFKMITPDDLKAAGISMPVGGDGKPIGFDRIQGSGTLVRVNDSRYAIALGNPDRPGEEGYVKSEKNRNENLILDFRALRPILAKRRPDLFLAGN